MMITKPIMSLMMMVDGGAEFWLSGKSGLKMYLRGDMQNAVELTRKNNTLGLDSG